MHPIIAKMHRVPTRTDLPEFRAGDTISVDFKVIEGAKERIQTFAGVVIQRRGSGVSETFTVRKISNNIPVERIFPLHSPRLAAVKVNRLGKVRRARIFYMRGLQGKAARIDERQEVETAVIEKVEAVKPPKEPKSVKPAKAVKT